MRCKNVLILLILVWLITACGGTATIPTSDTPLARTQSAYPSYEPIPTSQFAYPSPDETLQFDITPWYPAPGTPGAPAEGVTMTSGYEPQPSDVNLTRAEVFLELDSSQLIIMESLPIQVNANLNGNLPDPCHMLRVKVTAADAGNRINLEVYTLYNSEAVCTTVLQPFSATIPLGSYSGGHYTVYVNGELLGEFDS